MAEKQMLGMLSSGEIRDLANRAEIDTVWVVTPDQYGRPVGKRLAAKCFVDEVLDRQTNLPAHLLFKDIAGNLVQPPSTIRADPSATVHCRPDSASLRRAAWLERTAIAVCDVIDPSSGELHPFSPRAALKRQLERTRSASVTARGSVGLEFYLRGDATAPAAGGAPPHAGDHSAVQLVGDADLGFEIQRLLRMSGIPIDHVGPGAGAGQYEIAPQLSGLLEATDRAMILKWAVKEIGRRGSQRPTFMARPAESLPASSMEIHTSLWSTDRDAALFAAKETAERSAELPMACRWWLGGLLQHARESALLFAPTVNSYKRYRGDGGAGSSIAWTRDRHVVGFRVGGEGGRRRVTCSLAGADANPYLAGAASLAAGMDGMTNRADPPAEAERGASAMRVLPRVPLGLAEAADLAAKSTFIRQAIGEHYVEFLAHCGRWEQARFEAAVTSWEGERYTDQV